MRILPLVAALLLAGCADRDSSPATAEPTDAAADAAAPDPLGGAVSVSYRCETGHLVGASYAADSTVVLRYEGEVITLAAARAASGARYVGDGYEWWTRGSGPGAEATLSRLDGDSAEPVELCTAQE